VEVSRSVHFFLPWNRCRLPCFVLHQRPGLSPEPPVPEGFAEGGVWESFWLVGLFVPPVAGFGTSLVRVDGRSCARPVGDCAAGGICSLFRSHADMNGDSDNAITLIMIHWNFMAFLSTLFDVPDCSRNHFAACCICLIVVAVPISDASMRTWSPSLNLQSSPPTTKAEPLATSSFAVGSVVPTTSFN
jgi:hypothetical protein